MSCDRERPKESGQSINQSWGKELIAYGNYVEILRKVYCINGDWD